MRAPVVRVEVTCDRCGRSEEFRFEDSAMDAGWTFNDGPAEEDVCPACEGD